MHQDNKCLFCDIIKDTDKIVSQNSLAAAFRDSFPVTEGHTLIVPKRHIDDIFLITKDENSAMFELLIEIKQKLEIEYEAVDGFNIGVNSGVSAGQTVAHCHVHLIPRRSGDIENPKGGIRGAIPPKRIF